MTAKEYLEQIHDLDGRIRTAEKAIEDLEKKLYDRPGGSEADAVRVKSSPRQDPIGDMVSSIADGQIKLAGMIDQYVDLKLRIIAQIDAIPTARYREILRMRYVEKDKNGRQLSMADIAEAKAYEYYYTCQMHGKALLEFEDTYPEIRDL